jgi:hypothetical protein
MTNSYNQLASEDVINTAQAALEKNGIKVLIAENAEDAKTKALELTPKGAEVFALSSVTLEQTGIKKEIDESGNYDSVRVKLNALDRKTQSGEMRKLGAAPDYALGSAHAVTEDGKILIASNTGSQLPADVNGAGKLILVVGTQKIVKDLDQGFKRIYDYVLPLESQRINKVYNTTSGSFVSKILIFNRELTPDRITIILVKEILGY